MITWRFWPSTYLDITATDIGTSFRCLAEGSVIYQGTTFMLNFLAIFLRPMIRLNDVVAANPMLQEQLKKSGTAQSFVSSFQYVTMYLAPLAASIATVLIGR